MRRLAYLGLALAAILFGVSFVVVKEAIAELPPFAFIGWRFTLSASLLFLLAFPRGRRVWQEGAIAGLLVFAGYSLQTKGLAITSASNSALITGLYVVCTPLIAALVGRYRLRVWTLVGAVVAFFGLALLTVGDRLEFSRGDVLTVGCAVVFAAHIVYLSKVANRHKVIPFTAVQLGVTAVLALLVSIPTEGLPLPTRSTIGAIVITGLAVSGVAFLLQVWAQTVVGPSVAAIILAIEPVAGAGAATIALSERLTNRGWFGGGLILVGIYLVLMKGEDSADVVAAEAVTAAH